MHCHTFVGPFIHNDNNGQLVIIEQAVITVQNGKITEIKIDPNPEDSVFRGNNASGEHNITVLSDGQFFVPGFVDCHTHAVQLPNLGIGYDKDLLHWLDTYTFPLERKYVDEKFAERVFETVVKQSLTCGTTTACYFASLYSNSSVILGEKAAKHGQRAFIGKVNMNVSRSDGYWENIEDSVKNTKEFVKSIVNIGNPLIKPIITPRFALSCDMDLMKQLGKLAKEQDLHIQTHISENLSEIEAVKNMFKNYSTYAEVYDAANLLTNKTILAHGVHLKDSEIKLLKERGTAVIHCPSSNTCLKSGLCDVQRLKESGLKIGLGTDVSGGQSLSILDAMKSALQVSCHLSMLKHNYQSLDYKEVFHMATLGGAMSLAIDDKVGNFVVGKEFDALVIDTNNGMLNDLNNYTLEERLQKLIYCGDDRNIIKVYVNGRKVK